MASKTCVQFQTYPGETVRLVNESMMSWVKLIDPPLEDPFPTKRKIGRTWMDPGLQQAWVNMGIAGARLYFNFFRSVYESRRYIHAWECVNEPGVKTPEQRAALVVFTVEWSRLMHSIGCKVVVGNFSTGTPHPPEIHELAPIFEGAEYWSVREYSAPSMRFDVTWYNLRYRRLVAALREAGVEPPPLFIGESGVDGGMRDDHQPDWKGKGYLWFEQERLLSRSEHIADRIWYDEEAQKDSYVVAIFGFLVGGNVDWLSFEMLPILPALIVYVNSIAGQPTTPPPLPPPPVTPPPTAFPAYDEVIAAACAQMGVPYTPGFALWKTAVAQKLGVIPLKGECLTMPGFVFQIWPNGIVIAKIGQWDKVLVVRNGQGA